MRSLAQLPTAAGPLPAVAAPVFTLNSPLLAASNTTQQPIVSSGSSGFALGPVAYISGICLLVVVAVCLIVAACMLRRKDRRLAAGQRAEQEAQLAAAQQAAAAEAARRAANPPVIPVVIVQPDGVLELAEEVKIKAPWGGSSGGDPGGPGTGHPKAVPPIGFHVAQ